MECEGATRSNYSGGQDTTSRGLSQNAFSSFLPASAFYIGGHQGPQRGHPFPTFGEDQKPVLSSHNPQSSQLNPQLAIQKD